MDRRQHILDAIGNTPLVELRRIVLDSSARIVAKLESANPTGRIKDRLARMIVQRAAAGRLPPGGTVVEYTAERLEAPVEVVGSDEARENRTAWAIHLRVPVDTREARRCVTAEYRVR